MQARYTLTQDLAELKKVIRFIYMITDFPMRDDFSPRQRAPVLIGENHETVLKLMRWGLIPARAKSEASGDKFINVRAESLAGKPSLRRLFEQQRCLVPADGFYEWQATTTSKIPFRFTRKDGRIFCMAGLWGRWIRPHRDGELGLDDTGPNLSQIVETFAIVTTGPNPQATAAQHPVPVILSPQHFRRWLELDSVDLQFLKTLLLPCAAFEADFCRVPTTVNGDSFNEPN
jgi:putative SOS response-associated peptidase YedK